jgi:hypothetical protein
MTKLGAQPFKGCEICTDDKNERLKYLVFLEWLIARFGGLALIGLGLGLLLVLYAFIRVARQLRRLS